MRTHDDSGTSKAGALARARQAYASGAFAEDLARRVAFRTVSGPAVPDSELLPYYDEVLVPELTAMGFTCRQLPNPVVGASPFLFVERIESPGLLTLLTYGHGDVVPGYDQQWQEGLSPWVVTERDGAWYGRGVADNKGQHAVNLTALKAVLAARGGRLGYNVKGLYELGEERGSPGLREVCREHAEALKADVFIASDGPRVSRDEPTLFLGSRGGAIVELRCAPREGGLHSGNWGGIMKNPAVVLANAIATLVDGRGRILVERLLPPPISASVRLALSKLTVDSASLGRTLDEGWGEPGLSAAERLLGWNSLEVLSLSAGDAAKPVNAIPPLAISHLQLRFVVGTDWTNIEAILRSHLDAAGYADVAVRFVRGSPATRLDPDNAWVRWAGDAVAQVTGRQPSVVPNLGGTLPNDAFSDILGLPTVWVPHSYPGCRQHAANEHLPCTIVEQGLQMMASIFWELGEAAALEARRASGG
jgi:acetylornithine deacetylase/succinyl-diaminopimelate desuccinylase-like protein